MTITCWKHCVKTIQIDNAYDCIKFINVMTGDLYFLACPYAFLSFTLILTWIIQRFPCICFLQEVFPVQNWGTYSSSGLSANPFLVTYTLRWLCLLLLIYCSLLKNGVSNWTPLCLEANIKAQNITYYENYLLNNIIY